LDILKFRVLKKKSDEVFYRHVVRKAPLDPVLGQDGSQFLARKHALFGGTEKAYDPAFCEL
jgi:hypothetical protein